MQQIPRDNPIVKGCMRAAEGKKIVAMDLTTAEVYVAAVLADDKNLMDVFKTGGNFHSSIAKLVFNLPCEAEEVAELYSTQRQAAKAVTFGIMYGAGSNKISQQVTADSGKNFSKQDAQEVIDDYFRQFHKLKKWIDHSSKYITEVETLIGDSSKAKKNLGWVPKITAQEMCKEMVAFDLSEAKRLSLLKAHGFGVDIREE